MASQVEKPDLPVSVEDVYKMVEKVRCETRLSHKLACHAAYVVLENLVRLRPATSVTVNGILQTLEMPPEAPESLIDETQDMSRLFVIAEDLDSVRNDAQQRSWELFDDQATIMECLNELHCILMDADVAISKRFLCVTEYHIVNCLAEYYQMESRSPIKTILLKIFDQLCTLSKTAIVILLASVLPLELTSDIQNNVEDRSKLVAAVNILTKMFSIAEPLPIIYFDTIGKDFLLFLFNLIESPNNDADQEDLVVLLINFIVVYNLQFDNEKANITIEALSEAGNPKIFSETLLLLFNRARDPVRCVDHGTEKQNSLLKIMIDIFSHHGTSNLFYNNDVRVLIDITLRQLIDNSPKCNDRHHLLKLLELIFLKTDTTIYEDRIAEIQTCITQLPVEDEADVTTNQLINEISDHLNKLKNFFYYCPVCVILGCTFRILMFINDIYQILRRAKRSVLWFWYYDENLYSKNTAASCISLFIILCTNVVLLLGVLQDRNEFLFPWILLEGIEIFSHVISLAWPEKRVFKTLKTCVWKLNYWLMAFCLMVGRTCR